METKINKPAPLLPQEVIDRAKRLGAALLAGIGVGYSVQVANEKADAAGEDDWMDEDVVEIPDAPEDLKDTAHPEATETIERMLQGNE